MRYCSRLVRSQIHTGGLALVITDTQRAYERIKERIITTQMPPGAVIQETVLMAELGLGRTPIREALKLLEAEKLVVVSARRGMYRQRGQHFRPGGDPGDSLSSGSLVCPVSRSADHARRNWPKCGRWWKRRKLWLEKRDLTALMALDRRFHALLARSSCNELLEAELETLYNLSARIWYLYLDRLDQSDLAYDAWGEILAALETKDIGRAERAILRHIRDFGDAVRRHI